MYPNQNQQMPGQGGPSQGYPPQQQYAANPYNQPMIVPSSTLNNLGGFDKLMKMPGIH